MSRFHVPEVRRSARLVGMLEGHSGDCGRSYLSAPGWGTQMGSQRAERSIGCRGPGPHPFPTQGSWAGIPELPSGDDRVCPNLERQAHLPPSGLSPSFTLVDLLAPWERGEIPLCHPDSSSYSYLSSGRTLGTQRDTPLTRGARYGSSPHSASLLLLVASKAFPPRQQ